MHDEELAIVSITEPIGIAKDVRLRWKVSNFQLTDFVILGCEITLRLARNHHIQSGPIRSRYSADYNHMTVNKIDVIDMACDEYSQEGPRIFKRDREKELKLCEDKTVESSVDEPPEVELKELPPHLEYAFLEGDDKLPIPIDPKDQEKTTFTCPYGTFAYRRMPFGLCNAPGTFQRCMMAIFHDMIEKTMEKSHFMVKEGIVLGHKISKSGIEVDRAKVEVIAKLPHPTTVKGVRSFLGPRRLLATSHWGHPRAKKKQAFQPIHYASKTMSPRHQTHSINYTEKDYFSVVNKGHAKLESLIVTPPRNTHPNKWQVEVSNRGLKRILERTGEKIVPPWSNKLDDSFMGPSLPHRLTKHPRCTPYKLCVLEEACHHLMQLGAQGVSNVGAAGVQGHSRIDDMGMMTGRSVGGTTSYRYCVGAAFDFPDCEDSRASSIHKSFTSSASVWESSIQI
ncbi:hypothetical protein Tco_0532262 [Tanacetum coccineum]